MHRGCAYDHQTLRVHQYVAFTKEEAKHMNEELDIKARGTTFFAIEEKLVTKRDIRVYCDTCKKYFITSSYSNIKN